LREVARELGIPALGWLATGIVVALTLRTVWRTKPAPVVLVGIAAVFAALVSPHALFYEAGVVVLALAASADAFGRPMAPLLCAVWAIAALEPLRIYMPLPPSTIVLLVSLALSIWMAHRAAEAIPASSPV